MNTVLYYVCRIASSFLSVVQLLLVLRAILSWFAYANPTVGRMYGALANLTEPIVVPFRAITERIPFLRGIPLDFSIIVTYFALEVLRRLVWMLY